MSSSLLDHPLLACPMCMSGASGQSLLAANNAILLMLGFLFAVLASFACFIVYLARRARRFAEEEALEAAAQS
jgi:hypothetical protein